MQLDNVFENEVFNHIDASKNVLTMGEYNNCTFTACDFSNVDFSQMVFAECKFEHCNLSNTNLNNTGLKDVAFSHCKLMGLIFNNCNPFLLSMQFHDCQLDLSSFYQLKLKATIFKNCSLRESDFAEADLTNATLDNCDFSSAIFDQTILEKADFRNSFNYSIDPENNRIKKAIFDMPEALHLLDKYNIIVKNN